MQTHQCKFFEYIMKVNDETVLAAPGFSCAEGLLGDSVFVAVGGDI